jgi:hypothetical protein
LRLGAKLYDPFYEIADRFTSSTRVKGNVILLVLLLIFFCLFKFSVMDEEIIAIDLVIASILLVAFRERLQVDRPSNVRVTSNPEPKTSRIRARVVQTE